VREMSDKLSTVCTLLMGLWLKMARAQLLQITIASAGTANQRFTRQMQGNFRLISVAPDIMWGTVSGTSGYKEGHGTMFL
jgi:hypothetical protein